MSTKILFLNTLYDPYIGGGAEITLRYLTLLAQSEGYDTFVISLWEGDYIREEDINGISVYRLPIANLYFPYRKDKTNKLERVIWHLFDVYNPVMKNYLMKILQEIRPNLVSIHNICGWSSSCYDVMNKMNVPFIQVLHDQYLLCPKRMFKNDSLCLKQCALCRIIRYPYKLKSNKAIAVVGVSKFILKKTLSCGYFKGTPIKTYIYNYRPPFKEIVEHKKEKGKIYFGFIGTLAPHKGVEILLKIFKKIKKENWVLLIAGEGKKDYEDYLKTKYKDENVIFLGKIKPEKFFPRVNAIIVPSIWEEPLGMVIPEAFYFGIPVLGSKLGGIPEMIREGINGLLFDPYDEENFKNTILEFVKNISYWMAKKEDIKKTSQPFFDRQRWKREWTDIYERVLQLSHE
ncbi:MAG: hypothetical protein DRN92_04515 [Thermoproteota archaeon]|nr:MAG: hypothetical protein DRN92_04515 [Candidatus Korarchaeota archaeon]